MATRQANGSQRIGELQARQQRDEFRIGLRALLMQPLMLVWSEDAVPDEVAVEPLWSLGVLGDAAGAVP